MTSVSVAVLKQKLSSYLHLVEQGQAFVVTAHRRPVAHVMAASSLASCVRRPSSRPAALSGLKGARMSAGHSAVSALLEERARR